MKLTKRDWVLAVAAFITIVLAFAWQPTVIHSADTDTTRRLLAAGLKEKINDINKIEITQDNQRTTLHQDAKGVWRVKELYDYPASLPEIRKTLLYFSQSELRDAKTNDPEKLVKLGLSKDMRTMVALKNGDATLFELTIGRTSSDGGGTYVLPAEGTQSYLASGALTVKSSPQEWLTYDMFSIDRSRVKRIRYEFSGKRNYAFVREKTNQAMRLEPSPTDKILTRPTPLNPSYYFERLTFTDVLPESKSTTPTRDMTIMETFDGLVVTVRFVEVDLREMAQFSAHVVPSLRDSNNSSLLPLERVLGEAEAINALTAGWLYELGQFNSTQLRSSYYDLTR
jgi:Domain of unknown function (DUF4340)